MALSWEWVNGDDDRGVTIEPRLRVVHIWGARRNWQGPAHALPAGGRDVPFDQFLADGGIEVPENIRADVLAAVRALTPS